MGQGALDLVRSSTRRGVSPRRNSPSSREQTRRGNRNRRRRRAVGTRLTGLQDCPRPTGHSSLANIFQPASAQRCHWPSMAAASMTRSRRRRHWTRAEPSYGSSVGSISTISSPRLRRPHRLRRPPLPARSVTIAPALTTRFATVIVSCASTVSVPVSSPNNSRLRRIGTQRVRVGGRVVAGIRVGRLRGPPP